MNRFTISLVVLSLFWFGSCVKTPLPPPVSEDPVFSLNLLWTDSTRLDLAAGENRYYLYTGFERDEWDVFSFSGRFAQLDCLDQCEPGFAIYFRDVQVNPEESPDFPEFLTVGQSYGYAAPAIPTIDTLLQYRAQFTSTSNIGAVPLLWTFTDSINTITSLLEAPELVRADEIPFHACLEIGTPVGGCYSQQCQTVRLDSFPGFSALIESDSNSQVLMAVAIGGQAPYTYLWSNGGTNVVNQFIQPGGNYCVTITDAAEVESSNCIQAPFPGTTACVASFSYNVTPELEVTVVPGDSLQFKTVVLEYVEDGNVFRSDRQAQPPGSFFTIDAIQSYDANENGYPTLLIEARFSGLLTAENGEVRHVEEAEVVIAVAYGN